ncbi:WD40-repeat-containing domain protein [Endogone sp. FLAS-F59071]|nr:WD40-repeat-containing domain protein [Endogone sp. FLAS-F59071]|eukprot:RUS17920.1 WD40-repeat-containing domain protein [Endogone sp. FLAS-F59071]
MHTLDETDDSDYVDADDVDEEIEDEDEDDELEDEDEEVDYEEDLNTENSSPFWFLQNNSFTLSPARAASIRRQLAAGTTGLDENSQNAIQILLRAILQPTQHQQEQQQGRRHRNDSGVAALPRQCDQADRQKEAARELLKSGAFGIVDSGFGQDGVWRTGATRKNEIVVNVEDEMEDVRGPARKAQSGNGVASLNLTNRIWNRESRWKPTSKVALGRTFVPNQNGEVVEWYADRAYSGQYSQDGSFFYTCCQDFRVYIYNTSNPERVRQEKIIQGEIDAHLSPDNQWIIYSSINPYVYLAKTVPDENVQTPLNFSRAMDSGAGGIWSVRFSGNGREIVAGASVVSPNDRSILVYDIEARQVVVSAGGHADDVNAVCFADESSHVLLSGSDDSFIKVWDRRSLHGDTPAGVLVGHTEGLTYVASKGDGRYCLSNGKDQSMKLWDLRKMASSKDFQKIERIDLRKDWDYRNRSYPGEAPSHPNDCSVMTYRGHKVLRTLIRCHFSPQHSTGQRYLYTGSADGRIHVYSLDGTVHQVLNASKAMDEVDIRSSRGWSAYSYDDTTIVRDVSWHPYQPTMMSTSWSGTQRGAGVVLRHDWKEVERE